MIRLKKFLIIIFVLLLIFAGLYFAFPQQMGNVLSQASSSITNMFAPPSYSVDSSWNDDGVIVVVLDPGHGGAECGAVSLDGELVECDINLTLAKRLAQLLERSGIKVVLTHDVLAENDTMSLEERVRYARSCNADLFISMHHNANYPNYSGAEIYVSGRGTTSAKSARKLAEMILSELGSVGMRRRGVFYRMSQAGFVDEEGSPYDYYGVLRMSDDLGIPSMLLEHGFLNDIDREFIDTDEKIYATAKAEARAICAFFGVSYGEGLTQRPAACGDVNLDGVISSTDIDAAVSAVLCSHDAPVLTGYDNADMDGDGLIGAGDLLSLANLVRKQMAPPVKPSGEKTANQPRTDALEFSAGDTMMLWVQIGDWQNLSSFVGTVDYNPALFDFVSCPDLPHGLTVVEDANFGVLRFCYIAPDGVTAPTELTFTFAMRGTPDEDGASINCNIYSAAAFSDGTITEYSPSTACINLKKK